MKEYIERILEILREGGKYSVPTEYLTQEQVNQILTDNPDIYLNEDNQLQMCEEGTHNELFDL
tara:strand:- start:2235 stop:2423 length:189 start_codon:yes stop_codon:yes gene_type:complete